MALSVKNSKINTIKHHKKIKKNFILGYLNKMSTYREFVKEMMPKMMSHPPKERMKMIAVEWHKKKGGKAEKKHIKGGQVTGGMVTGGQVTGGMVTGGEEGGMMTAGKLKKSLKSGLPRRGRTKALGGFLSALGLSLPEEMKDSNNLSVANAKKLIIHVAKTHGAKFADSIVSKLKDMLDHVKFSRKENGGMLTRA